MRGKPPNVAKNVFNGGLIPAYAGKTLTAYLDGGTYTAHPRVCGENLDRRNDAHHRPGSSPRMRGKPVMRIARPMRRGLIPAYAGKTSMYR